MRKLVLSSLLACGLLLLDSPEAAAHNEGRYQDRHSDRNYSRSYDRDYHGRKSYRPGKYYATKYERSHRMPRWLKRDRSFYRWYRRSDYRYDNYVPWQRVFDIYVWERSRSRYRHH